MEQLEAKGIDDAIRNGRSITTLKKDDALLHVELNLESAGAADKESEFKPLRKLPPLLDKVDQMPVSLLPDPLKDWIQDCADRMNIPREVIACPAIASIATLLSHPIVVQPKRHDDTWSVATSTLWNTVVAHSGRMKSDSFRIALEPFNFVVNAIQNNYRQLIAERLPNVKKLGYSIKCVERKLSSPKTKENQRQDLEKQLVELNSELESYDTRKVTISTNDMTQQKICDVLSESNTGITIFRDELMGWIKDLDKDFQSSARQFYLKAWNGTGAENGGTVGRGICNVNFLFLVVIGGIQPEVIYRIAQDAMKNGQSADGLLQRFQLMVVPDYTEFLNYVDRSANENALINAKQLFLKIAKAQIRIKNGYTEISFEENQNEVPFLNPILDEAGNRIAAKVKFDEYAQQVWDDFANTAHKRAKDENEPPAIQSFLSKQRSTMAALALIFHILNLAAGLKTSQLISKDEAEMAFAWCRYLEKHARLVFEMEELLHLKGAHSFLVKAKEEKNKFPMTLRTFKRNKWNSLRDSAICEGALDVLVDSGVVSLQKVGNKHGPDSFTIKLNPKFLMMESIQ